jgi:hypothetical protein
MFQIIPEHIIRKAAFDIISTDGDENNIFTRALEDAQLYRKADLNPVYIYNMGTLGVTSAENLQNMYN